MDSTSWKQKKIYFNFFNRPLQCELAILVMVHGVLCFGEKGSSHVYRMCVNGVSMGFLRIKRFETRGPIVTLLYHGCRGRGLVGLIGSEIGHGITLFYLP